MDPRGVHDNTREHATNARTGVGPPTPGPGRSSQRLGPRILGKHPLGWLFSAPYLIFVLLIFAYPLIFAGYMSFHDYFFAAPGVEVDRPFVGLENYQALFTDPDVRRSFVNVGIFLIINVPLTVVISMVLATLLNRVVRLKTFLRVAFYVPYVTASVAVVAVWLFLFSGGGLVNTLLGPLAPDPTWLISPTWAMPSIAFFVTWKGMGVYILLYLAALQNVGQELYESAATDGATRLPASGTSPCPACARPPCWSCCWPP